MSEQKPKTILRKGPNVSFSGVTTVDIKFAPKPTKPFDSIFTTKPDPIKKPNQVT